MYNSVKVRDLILELVGDDGFGLSLHLKRVAGQSRTIIRINVLSNECADGLGNAGLGLFLASMGLVVVLGRK
jgi:hypothetical protein